ncbi:MAG: hypothetical protein GVY26_21610 [Bacteroidetes bacterium]|jgi:hypothetical protein|nr:hypothetical protein [Bacteroidota bacterium]
MSVYILWCKAIQIKENNDAESSLVGTIAAYDKNVEMKAGAKSEATLLKILTFPANQPIKP